MKSHHEADEWYSPAIKLCFVSKLYCLHRVLEVTPERSSGGHGDPDTSFPLKMSAPHPHPW